MLVSWLTGGVLCVYGQCGNSASFTGSLKIPNAIGCIPFRVQPFSDLPGVQNIRYVYEYDGVNESKTSTLTEYTYTKPGIYRILQLSEKEGRPLRACAIIEVYDTLQPAVNFTSCFRQVSLEIPRPADYSYDYYVISWGDGKRDTLRNNPYTLNYQFSDDTRRLITVQGIHRFGKCGGTTVQFFEPKQPIQPPVLEAPISQGNQLRLAIRNPTGISFRVEQQDGNSSFLVIQTATRQTSLTFLRPIPATQRTCFRLVLTDSCYAATAYPPVCYEPTSTPTDTGWYLPTAFTPNSDGLNDTFGIVGDLQANGFRIAIYDRWGRVVYETSDPYRPWDGTVSGQPALVGQYYYRLALWQTGQAVQEKRGTVLLVR